MRKIIAVIALVLILAGVNWSIYQKEQHLATGAVVYLKLRPVDPRSLMQGDYMRLGFELADKISAALFKKPRGGTSWSNRHRFDAIDGYVAVEGWAEKSTMLATDLAKEFADAGVEAIICTDVGRDGTLTGVNVDFTLEIARASGVATIASGGVKDIEDIITLHRAKEVSGVIIGKAFYEQTLDLKEAFKVASK